jgi:Mg-chelatase subunit ChlD
MITSYNDFSDSIADSMTESELTTLVVRTEKRCEFVEAIFGKLSSSLEFAKDYTIDTMSGALDVNEPYHSYYGVVPGLGELPSGGLEYDEPRGEDVSFVATNWFKREIDAEEDIENIMDLLNQTSHLDNVLIPIVQANDEFASMYFGTENEGLFRQAPYMSSSSMKTSSYTCHDPNRYMQSIPEYDPRCRSWYQGAKAKGEGVTHFFSEPYNDATTNRLMITDAISVYDLDDTFVGVVAVDVYLDYLDGVILSSNVLDHGYAYMINISGLVIVHPDKGTSVEDIYDLEFSSSAEEDDFRTNVMDEIDWTNYDVSDPIIYEKNGHQWYLTYKIVQGPEYLLVFTVPVSDITDPIDEIQVIINIRIATSIGISIMAIVMVGIIMFVGIEIFSDFVIKPIKQLEQKLGKMAKRDYSVDVGGNQTHFEEIDSLETNVGHLLTAVRFGNSSYYSGDTRKALDNYGVALNLMKQFKNEEGKGVCYNNIGNVKFQEGNYDAKRYYELAIQNIGNLIKTCKQEKMSTYNIILADRLGNLAICLSKMTRNMEQIIDTFDKAEQLHLKYDNIAGYAKALNNHAKYLLEFGYTDQANVILEKAEQMIKGVEVIDDITRNYMILTRAMYFHKTANHTEGIRILEDVLQSSSDFDKSLFTSYLTELSAMYKAIGNEDKAKELDKQIGVDSQIKHVLFNLDASWSMESGRFDPCKRCIRKIIDDYLNDQDYISMYTFATDVRRVFTFFQKTTDLEMIHQEVRGMRCRGQTAFYDAVLESLNTVTRTQGQSDDTKKWVIALTDGEDNKSRRNHHGYVLSYPTILKKLRDSDVDLIIITIGPSYDHHAIDEMVKTSEDSGNLGFHLSADRDSEIEKAFSKVSKIISSQLNVEVL